jgi:hypothetical protein
MSSLQVITVDASDAPFRFRAKRDHLERFEELSPKGQGQILVLTVLYVLNLTDNGTSPGWSRPLFTWQVYSRVQVSTGAGHVTA